MSNENIEIKKNLNLTIIQENKIKVEGLIADLKINNKRIELIYFEDFNLESKESAIVEFEYENFIFNIKVDIIKEENKVFLEFNKLNEKKINEDREFKVNEYGIFKNKNNEIKINLIKITKNKVFFNVLKKDKNFIFDSLDTNCSIDLILNKENINLKINPKIENISENEDILIYSKININIESKENKKIFEDYLEKNNEIQNQRERKILIDNLIKEIL
jgi:hypothetical protein